MTEECARNRRDVKTALIIWMGMMVAYGCIGVVSAVYNISLGILINPMFCAVCIIIVIYRKQNIASLGLTKNGVLASCTLGILCSAMIVLLNGVLPGLIKGEMLGETITLIRGFFYYMFIIAFPEEIFFRGYLMTRLENAVDTKKAIIISGVLFVLIHVPYPFMMFGTNFMTYLLNGYLVTLIMTFLWHLVFCWIFKKTGALYGSILFHGFIDWSNILFQ